MTIRRGAPALRHLLTHHLRDLRSLEPADFPAWLAPHLERWRCQPEFALRERIRDLRRAHPDLLALEAERDRALAEYRAAALHDEIDAARRGRVGAEQAIEGLTRALRTARPAKRDALRGKLDGFLAREDELRALDARLTADSPERLALDRVTALIERVREELGLAALELRRRDLHRTSGRSSTRSGKAFEADARDAVREVVVPQLIEQGAPSPVEILREVTLGAARTEIDQLVVRPGSHPEAPVEVLALVEAKRNLNDVAHGLRRRLENLAWLTGWSAAYDAESYRTHFHPTGHFDGVAEHVEEGRRWRVTRESFRRFLPDLERGTVPAGLYLVTRPGTLWGIGSGGLARIAHRVSGDEAWEPDDPEYMAELLRWARGLAHEVEAPEVLLRFVDEGAADRVVLVAK